MSSLAKTLFFLLMLSLCIPLQAAEAPPSAMDQHGQSHVLHGDSRGWTVIDFAASWCGPCRESLPRLEDFAAAHPEVRVLVVSVDDKVSGRDRLVEDLGLQLPVLWDADYAISQKFRPETMPTTLVLDENGSEIYRHGGSAEADWQAFVAMIDHRESP